MKPLAKSLEKQLDKDVKRVRASSEKSLPKWATEKSAKIPRIKKKKK